MRKELLLFFAIVGIVAFNTQEEVFSAQKSRSEEAFQSEYDKIYNSVSEKEGVKEITYEEFMRIRNSKEGYVLLDVLSVESFNKNHIPHAESFPLDTINKETAEKRIIKEAKVIVYCGGFGYHASTVAAQKLSSYGYKVLDYKGGLQEWQDMGNKFSSVQKDE